MLPIIVCTLWRAYKYTAWLIIHAFWNRTCPHITILYYRYRGCPKKLVRGMYKCGGNALKKSVIFQTTAKHFLPNYTEKETQFYYLLALLG